MGTEQAEGILNAIPEITIFGKPNCKFCDNAKETLTSVELPFDYRLLEEELCTGEDPVTGQPRKLRDDWRTCGLVDLLSMWTMCDNPVPFIVIDGIGYKNLSAALDALNYRERKKLVMKRRRDAAETDPRTDA